VCPVAGRVAGSFELIEQSNDPAHFPVDGTPDPERLNAHGNRADAKRVGRFRGTLLLDREQIVGLIMRTFDNRPGFVFNESSPSRFMAARCLFHYHEIRGRMFHSFVETVGAMSACSAL